MKTERQLTTLGLVVSTLIVLIEIYGGKIFHSYTLIVGGYYTLSIMALEFVCFIASVVRGRRANTKVPFGFGKSEAAAGTFLGIVLVFISLFIIIKAFFLNFSLSDLRVMSVVLYLALFEYLKSALEFKVAKDNQSQMLFSIAHDTYYNAYVTGLIIIFIILSSFIKIFDLIGSIIISLFILYKGIKIIVDNVVLIKGQNDKAKGIYDEIKKVINKEKEIKFSNLTLTNVNNFYITDIELLIDNNVSINKLVRKEIKLRRRIKKMHLKIKMIDFEIYTK